MQYSAVTRTEEPGELVEGEANREDENRTSGTYGPIFLRVMIFSTAA